MKSTLYILLIALFGFIPNKNCEVKSTNVDSCPCAVVTPPDTTPVLNPIGLIVMCGQSNMEGNNASDVLSSPYTLQYSNPTIYYKRTTLVSDTGKVQAFWSGKNNQWRYTYLSNIGPETSLAYELSKQDKKYGIVKYSLGGSALVDAFQGKLSYSAGIWCVNTTKAAGGQFGKHFDTLMQSFILPAIQRYKNLGYTPYIEAFSWCQGEYESGTGTYEATHYEPELKRLIDSFKVGVNPYASTQNMKVIISRIHNNFKVGTRPQLNAIRTALVNTANYYGSNGYWINTDLYPIRTDSVHWSKSGQIIHGQDIANIILSTPQARPLASRECVIYNYSLYKAAFK